MREKQEHNFLDSYDLTNTERVMKSKEQEGLDRQEPKITHNDVGADKANREVAELRKLHALESPTPGTHMEAGEELPNEIKDEAKKIETANGWIKDPGDPNDMTKFLQENIN